MLFRDLSIGQNFKYGHWPNGKNVIWIKFSNEKAIALSMEIGITCDIQPDAYALSSCIINICRDIENKLFSEAESKNLNCFLDYVRKVKLPTLEELYSFKASQDYSVWAYDSFHEKYVLSLNDNIDIPELGSYGYIWPTISMDVNAEVEFAGDSNVEFISDFNGNLNKFLGF